MQENKAKMGMEDHFNEARFIFNVNYDKTAKKIN